MPFRSLVAPLACIALVCALAACEDEASPAEPTRTPSSAAPTELSPSPTETEAEPTGTVEPTLPAAAGGDGKAAVEAFVRFYWEVVDYAQESGDVSLLRSLAHSNCGGCDGGTDWIEEVHSRRGTIAGGSHRLSRLTAQEAPNKSHDWVAVMHMEVTPQRVRGAGDENLRSDGGVGTYTMVVTPGRNGWLVADLQVG